MATNGRNKVAYNAMPFDEEEEDEVDDMTFVSHPKQGSSGYVFGGSNWSTPDHRNKEDEAVDRRQQLMHEIDTIQRRTLESSARSLGLVHESEEIGVATAKDLLLQREQLEKCETKVADVNRSLRQSQKHINSIKSIFGGFMNRFSKNQADSAATPIEPAAKKHTDNDSLEERVTASNSLLASADSRTMPTHPALRLRGLNYDSPEMEKSTNPFDEAQPSSAVVAQQLDRNLDDLGLGLSRLKGLAIGLGDEIEGQNEILSRLGDSVDRADVGIQRQRKQMDKILKK